jgi:hypothetical protein
MKMTCGNEGESGKSHPSLFVCGWRGDSHQCLIVSLRSLDVPKATSAWVTSDAICIQGELPIFIPKALLICEEQK